MTRPCSFATRAKVSLILSDYVPCHSGMELHRRPVCEQKVWMDVLIDAE